MPASKVNDLKNTIIHTHIKKSRTRHIANVGKTYLRTSIHKLTACPECACASRSAAGVRPECASLHRSPPGAPMQTGVRPECARNAANLTKPNRTRIRFRRTKPKIRKQSSLKKKFQERNGITIQLARTIVMSDCSRAGPLLACLGQRGHNSRYRSINCPPSASALDNTLPRAFI